MSWWHGKSDLLLMRHVYIIVAVVNDFRTVDAVHVAIHEKRRAEEDFVVFGGVSDDCHRRLSWCSIRCDELLTVWMDSLTNGMRSIVVWMVLVLVK